MFSVARICAFDSKRVAGGNLGLGALVAGDVYKVNVVSAITDHSPSNLIKSPSAFGPEFKSATPH